MLLAEVVAITRHHDVWQDDGPDALAHRVVCNALKRRASVVRAIVALRAAIGTRAPHGVAPSGEWCRKAPTR